MSKASDAAIYPLSDVGWMVRYAKRRDGKKVVNHKFFDDVDDAREFVEQMESVGWTATYWAI